ncbi:MAG: NAD-dependent epimerase [Planctomycetota bacterium]|jgi:UDP-glucuronate 4-epimerase|nr:NAD-dependent epimerase [Planctomycetota bacterium]
MTVLLTGAAGFIGMHTAQVLLACGEQVVGIDNCNDYYPPALKRARLARLADQPGFTFHELDLADRAGIERLFADHAFTRVCHLGAQAGVRYSLENPHAYIDSNVVGTMNILEGCRHHDVQHLVYASSSSVYGLNAKMPFATSDGVDHPVSLYAATKKANELMAHTYSHLYQVPTTGLRFFTVYGPWGRPDMAYWTFTKKILAGDTIPVFNHGKMRRDFTYIDDIVEGVVRLLDKPATADPGFDREAPSPAGSSAPYKVYNIGNHQPVELLEFIRCIERATGCEAKLDLQPMQAGDVEATYADTQALQDAVGFAPSTPLQDGIDRFVAWYRDYHG